MHILSIRRTTHINDPGDAGPHSQLSDAQIAALVGDLFANAEGLEGIEITVQEGYVTLSGAISSLRDKVRAELLASQIRGVVDVDNQLSVRAPSRRAPDS